LAPILSGIRSLLCGKSPRVAAPARCHRALERAASQLEAEASRGLDQMRSQKKKSPAKSGAMLMLPSGNAPLGKRDLRLNLDVRWLQNNHSVAEKRAISTSISRRPPLDWPSGRRIAQRSYDERPPLAAARACELEIARFVLGACTTAHSAGPLRRYRALMLKAMGDMCRATRLPIMDADVSRNFLKCAVARCASKAVSSS
jgi:hypothetical protein